MNELYWLTRLDGLHTFGIVCIVVSIMFALIIFLSCGIDCYDLKEYMERLSLPILKKIRNVVVSVFIFGVLDVIFCPTQQDLYLIYGLGGTIDYIKSNPSAQKIPDKCVDALDKWLDSVNKK